MILGSKGQGSGAQGPLACVFSDCRRTHDEEPLLWPVFIHVNDVVRQQLCLLTRRGFSSLRKYSYYLLLHFTFVTCNLA